MSTNKLNFYSTALDLAAVLAEAERVKPMQYAQAGLFESDIPRIYYSYADIPNFGRAVRPTAIANPTYLVTMPGNQIVPRRVPQPTGGVLFAIDQQVNGQTAALRPGGRFGNDVILCGVLGTISQRSEAIDLYRALARTIRRSFIKEGQSWVGREAREARSRGVRLTIGADSPREFDLEAPPQD